MSDSGDRRIKQRFAAPCLKVQLHERKLFGARSAVDTTCLDLNRYGLALLSPRPIAAGTRLLLDFEGRYISESRVAARVISCRPYQAGYRLSIQFSYCRDQKDYSRGVDNAVSRIEGIYNRYAS
ncbi:PilZ domain-containing protein [Marinobacter xestospongiae]|nr:PilZ domain-containing protein [Marinobacter xestospongiae]MCK7566933.1 PilZ domain-containing protein [Marinobacter xestospongiae]